MALFKQPWVVSGLSSGNEMAFDYNAEGGSLPHIHQVWLHLFEYPENFYDEQIIEGQMIVTRCLEPRDLLIMEMYDRTSREKAFILAKIILEDCDHIPPGFEFPDTVLGNLWIQFAFEFWPAFCYRCGKLKHHQSKCMELGRNGEPLKHRRSSTTTV